VLSLSIAARFLRKSPAQSILIAAGIAIGIGVQVFLGSLITSLQASLIDQTIGNSPQLIVQATAAGAPLDYTSGLQLAMKNEPQITTSVPTRSFSAIFKKGAESAPLQLIGGQLAQLDTIYDISGRLVSGTAQLGAQQVMVGKDFADTYGLEPGDTASFVLPDGKPAELAVSGVFDFGSAAANSTTAFVDGG
jgi:lipoprotein-releasing system permease protein